MTPGSNLFCCTDQKAKNFDDFGPAIVLYFRHLKTSIWFMFVCCILSSILTYMYNKAYDAAKTESTSSLQGAGFFVAMRDYSLSSSLGGFSYGSTKFYEANFTNITNLSSTSNNLITNDSNKIKMDCIQGTIDVSQDYTYYGLIPEQFPSSYTFYMFIKNANINSNFYTALSTSSCEGQKSCNVTYSADWFYKDIANPYIEGQNSEGVHKLYIKYHCKDITMTFFGKTFKKPDLNYLIILINVLIFISFLIFLANWSFYESKIFGYFSESHPLPSDFTIKIKNLPQDKNEEDLKQEIYDHFETRNHSLKIASDSIVDVNFAKDYNVLYLDKLIRNYDLKITCVMDYFVDEKIVPQPEGTITISYILQYKKDNPNAFIGKNLSKFDKLMENIREKQKYEALKIKNLEKKQNFRSVFVTFNKNVNMVKFFNKMKLTRAQSCAMRFCCSSSDGLNNFQGKILKAKKPSEPSNILWKNLQVTPFEKTIRRVISFIFTILLIALPVIAVIIISLNLKNKETFKFSCPSNSIFTTDLTPDVEKILINDYKADKKSENLMFCYCYSDFTGRYNK